MKLGQTSRRWCMGPHAWLSVAFLAAALLLAAAARSAGAQGSSSADIGAGFTGTGTYLMPPKSAGPPPPGIGPMYRASAIVTGTDMRQRPWGFARCLREVLIKVSADPRLENDPRTARLAKHADRFVAYFSYVDLMAADPLHDEQGTYDRPYRLTVYFDPVRIDAALAAFGERPWRGVRPAIVPVLRVTGPKPPPYVLSAEIAVGAAQRGAFAVAAGEFGMTVRFPTKAELAAWGVSATHFPSSTAQAPPNRSPGEMDVVGTLEWSESLPGWIGRWRADWNGTPYRWGVKGVNYDAAFRDIVSGVVLLASGRGSPD
ncbi:MAG TPA: DUF2066 domain-containing protein [Acetobacteraceae bacterium]|nr:DUF2066 domain-containing protein [Acetobacteraceae bacterium]